MRKLHNTSPWEWNLTFPPVLLLVQIGHDVYEMIFTDSIHGMRALTSIEFGCGSVVSDSTIRTVRSPLAVRSHAHASFRCQAPMTSHMCLLISIVDIDCES